MTLSRSLLALLLVATCFATGLHAQTGVESVPGGSAMDFLNALTASNPEPESGLTAPVSSESTDVATQERIDQLYSMELENRKDSIDHRQRSREWQLFASKVVFWVVLGIVGTGLLFSWMQFTRKPQVPKAAPGGDVASAGATEQQGESHQFTAGVGPLQLSASSPALGVIVLTISIVFFYLYLTVVYPITPIGGLG